jgi:hypothetical protein
VVVTSGFLRLGIGILCAMLLVYLLMAANFQSWIDPLIVLSTIPSGLGDSVDIISDSDHPECAVSYGLAHDDWSSNFECHPNRDLRQ